MGTQWTGKARKHLQSRVLGRGGQDMMGRAEGRQIRTRLAGAKFDRNLSWDLMGWSGIEQGGWRRDTIAMTS